MKVYSQLEVASLENLSADPSLLPTGRMWWDTTQGRARVRGASNIRSVLLNDDKLVIGNSGTASDNVRLHRATSGVLQIVPATDSTTEGSAASSIAQLGFRATNHTTAGRPATGNAGRIIFDTDFSSMFVDTGSAWVPVGGGGYAVSTNQLISDGGTVTTSTIAPRQMRLVSGNAAVATLSLTPFGAVGGWIDGTEILLVGTDDTNLVILTYNDAAKGLVGNFSTIELTRFRSIVCVYSSSLDRWIVEGGF